MLQTAGAEQFNRLFQNAAVSQSTDRRSLGLIDS